MDEAGAPHAGMASLGDEKRPSVR